MTPVLAALAAALVLSGGWLTIVGMRRVPLRPKAIRRTRRSRTALLAAVGALIGLVVALTTGWVIAIVVVPALLAGLPVVLGPSPRTAIAKLEALEEWSRSLAGVLTAGLGLEQALTVTLRSTPEAIRTEVTTLVGRLNARWPTEQALRAFADDLDDATGDLVAAKLILAARRRGPGLASVLESLAESVAGDVRSRRQVEADRDKPRAAVRWITVITLGALALLAANRDYVEAYRSPLGQVALVVLLGLDAACLVWMRVMTRPVRNPRFIGTRLRGSGPHGGDEVAR